MPSDTGAMRSTCWRRVSSSLRQSIAMQTKITIDAAMGKTGWDVIGGARIFATQESSRLAKSENANTYSRSQLAEIIRRGQAASGDHSRGQTLELTKVCRFLPFSAETLPNSADLCRAPRRCT